MKQVEKGKVVWADGTGVEYLRTSLFTNTVSRKASRNTANLEDGVYNNSRPGQASRLSA